MSQQSPGQAIESAVKTIASRITTWLKLVAGLVLTVLITSTLLNMLGHPIPYVPAFKGSMQEIGIFTAALAYWLK